MEEHERIERASTDDTTPGDDLHDAGASAPELEELRRSLAQARAERDFLLHSSVASTGSLATKLARRWIRYTSRLPKMVRGVGRQADAARMLLTLRWPPGIRINPLFDLDFYRERYPDAPLGRRAAYRQYLRLSKTHDRDPSPHFRTGWYRQQNPDVAAGRWPLLDHYLHVGWREGRDPAPDFDGLEYLRHNPDAAIAGVNPLLHRMHRERDLPVRRQLRPPWASDRVPELPPQLRRVLVHRQRYGARRTLARIAEVIRERDRERADTRSFTSSVRQVDPHQVSAHLDMPRPGASEAASTLSVSGWAFADSRLRDIRIQLDGQFVVAAETGQLRADVGSLHPRRAQAATSGFSARVPLGEVDPGRHVLEVIVTCASGPVRVLSRSFRRVSPDALYHDYYERALPTAAEVSQLRARITSGAVPAIHIVVIDDPDRDIALTLRSVTAQRGVPALTCAVVTDRDRADLEGELSRLEQAVGASVATVGEMAMALPEREPERRLIGILEAGETLAPDALLMIMTWKGVSDADLVYADHDVRLATGRHVRPWFAPDWSPSHLLAQDYVGGFFLVRDSAPSRRLLDAALADPTLDGRYSWLLGVGADARRVLHIPRVAWSAPDGLAADVGERADRELVSVVRHLEQEGHHPAVSTAIADADGAIREISWPLGADPLVSIVIPTTGRLDLVERTMTALRQRTDYPRTEIVFIDNSRGRHPDGISYLHEQGVTVVTRDEPFNWARLNNAGAAQATGDLLLFMNDDLDTTDASWLERLVRQAQRDDVGVVGPLLTYPDGRVQHAGVFLVDHGGGAVHLFHGAEPDADLYRQWHRVAREVSAVTGACLLVPRASFEEVGGFEEELAVVGNDIDFCLRVRRTGRSVHFEPAARLVHHESSSRTGIDYSADESRLWGRWADMLIDGDPHFNPNLSQRHVDAVLDWPSVADRPTSAERADPASGVNLVGYVRAEMGLGEAVRGEALALTAAELPFVVIEQRLGTPARQQDERWSHRIVDDPVFETNLLHINADLLPQALAQLPADLAAGRHNVGYWTWELPEFPSKWAGSFELVDEVWVPSAFVRDALGERPPIPVHVVPHVIRCPEGRLADRRRWGLDDDVVAFLAMYDTQSVMQRKNPEGAIRAYAQAFPRDDGTSVLVLKINSPGQPELDKLRRLIGDRSDVRIISDVLSRAEMDSLMASCDVFVSLHRAEGFGLPIAEAMALSKPVVATGWSGNMEFMDPDVACCVEFELISLTRSYGPYPSGSTWAEPDIEDASEWMRRLHDDGDLRSDIGSRAAERIATNHSPERIGGIIADRLRHASPV